MHKTLKKIEDQQSTFWTLVKSEKLFLHLVLSFAFLLRGKIQQNFPTALRWNEVGCGSSCLLRLVNGRKDPTSDLQHCKDNLLILNYLQLETLLLYHAS